MTLLLLVACTAETAPPGDDTGGDTGDTGGESGDTGDSGGGVWTASAACGAIRFVATDGTSGLGMDLRVDEDLYAALLTGTVTSGTWSVDDGGYGVLVSRVVEDGELCSSIEEWVATSDADPWWAVTAGSIAWTLTPARAFGEDANNSWSWDGTPLGTVDLATEGLDFDARGAATEGRAVPAFTTSVAYTKVDLPA